MQNRMYMGYFVLVVFTLCLAESYPVFPSYQKHVKRHAADMKMAQYMACMNKDCRNIGWGLVDIFESGRRKRGEIPEEIFLPLQNEYEVFPLEDSEKN